MMDESRFHLKKSFYFNRKIKNRVHLENVLTVHINLKELQSIAEF